jgi:hypothetical protein
MRYHDDYVCQVKDISKYFGVSPNTGKNMRDKTKVRFGVKFRGKVTISQVRTANGLDSKVAISYGKLLANNILEICTELRESKGLTATHSYVSIADESVFYELLKTLCEKYEISEQVIIRILSIRSAVSSNYQEEI